MRDRIIPSDLAVRDDFKASLYLFGDRMSSYRILRIQQVGAGAFTAIERNDRAFEQLRFGSVTDPRITAGAGKSELRRARAHSKGLGPAKRWMKVRRKAQVRQASDRDDDLLPLRLIAHRKVGAVRMMKNERADAGFRIHHHSFGQMHADLFGAQQDPEPGLIVEVGASRITEAITFAAIA